MTDDQKSLSCQNKAHYVFVFTDALGKVKVTLGYGTNEQFDSQQRVTALVSPAILASQYDLSRAQFSYIQENRGKIQGHIQEEIKDGLAALIKKLQEGGD